MQMASVIGIGPTYESVLQHREKNGTGRELHRVGGPAVTHKKNNVLVLRERSAPPARWSTVVTSVGSKTILDQWAKLPPKEYKERNCRCTQRRG
jgi:hypothetical protein